MHEECGFELPLVESGLKLLVLAKHNLNVVDSHRTSSTVLLVLTFRDGY